MHIVVDLLFSPSAAHATCGNTCHHILVATSDHVIGLLCTDRLHAFVLLSSKVHVQFGTEAMAQQHQSFNFASIASHPVYVTYASHITDAPYV